MLIFILRAICFAVVLCYKIYDGLKNCFTIVSRRTVLFCKTSQKSAKRHIIIDSLAYFGIMRLGAEMK